MKKINLLLIIAGIVVLFSLILSLGVRAGVDFEFLSPSENYNVEYENLSEEEIQYSKNLVERIYPDFLSTTEKIIFTKNVPVCPSCYGINKVQSKTIYINWNYGGVSSGFKDIKEQVYISFCHELLHFWIPVQHTVDYRDADHRIIKYLSENGACYKKSTTERYINT